MAKKQGLVRSKNSKPYWGVLAWDTASKSSLTPDDFMKLLQLQYQNASVPGKAKQPGDRLRL